MARIIKEKEIIIYSDENGKEPFSDWISGLKDIMGRKRILVRLERIAQGNYGDCQSVGEGVLELRLFFGGGYRVYFGEDGDTLVVLLCGGDKSTQNQDIKNAKSYWKEYLENEKI